MFQNTTNNGQGQMIFEKATDAHDRYFRVKIHSSNCQMFVDAEYSGIGEKHFDKECFPIDSWEYWAVSVQLNSDATTNDIRIIKAVADTEETFSGSIDYQIIDRGGETHIGIGHDGTGTKTYPMWGFMYNFHIDQGYYSKGAA